jgi:hypothetical protein
MVSLKEIIKNIRDKRGLKKAIETGNELAQAGVTPTTPQTTTGAYVTPSGEVEVKRGGQVISTSSGSSKTTTTPFTQTTTQTSSFTPTQQVITQQTQQQLLQRQVTQQPTTVMTRYGGVSTAYPTKYQTYIPSTQYTYGQTKVDYGKQIPDKTAYLPGTIYSYQVGEYKGVPVYQTRVVQETGESRFATKEEARELSPLTVEEGEGPKTKIGRFIGEEVGETKKFLETEEGAAQFIEKPIQEWGEKGGKGRKVVSEIITGIIPTTKGEIISTVASFGLGSLMGAGVRGGERAVSLIGERAARYTVPIYRGVITAGGVYTTGRYISGISKQVKETGSFESVGEGFRDLALFGKGFKTGTKFTEKWTTPYTKEIPLKDLGKQFREGRYYEEAVGKTDTGQTLYKYTGLVERKPITTKITTTKLREKFPRFFKPLKISGEPAKFSVLETIEPQVRGGKSFGVKETVEGRKYATIYEVGGKSVPTDLKQFNQLSRQEQLQWKRIAERALNRKVNKEDVPRLLNENIEKVNELIYSVKLGRVKLTDKTLEIKTPFEEGFKGFKPTVEISQAVSASKTIKTPSGEFSISQTYTGFTPKKTIKTTTVEKLGVEDLKDLGVTEFKGGGKKSSEQFLNNLYQVQEQKVLELPKPNVKVPKYTGRVIQEQVPEQIPFMTGGKGLKIIPYSSEMTDEVTELGSSRLPSVSDTSLSISTGTLEIEKQIDKTFSSGRSKSIQLTKIDESLKPREDTKVRELIKPREILKVSEVLKTPQSIKQLQIPLTRQVFKPRTKIVPKVKERIKPFVLGKNKPEKLLKTKRKRKLGEEQFLAITKRRGKEVVVGIARTPKEAEMIAKKDVLGRLSATVKVKSTKGKQVQLTPSLLFRQSKTDPLSLVQRPTARLSSLGERQEIKESRRRRFSLL